ncbi:hypothetical protein OQA88_7178 [Cercophora sp. LCS_1]
MASEPVGAHCAVCKTGSDTLTDCNQCRGVQYCSDECAIQDKHLHRKLCWKFRHTKRPDDEHFRVFLFPGNASKPSIAFVKKADWKNDIVRHGYVEVPSGGRLMAITLEQNYLTGRPVNGWLKILFTKWTGQGAANKSIPHLFDLQGTPQARIP